MCKRCFVMSCLDIRERVLVKVLDVRVFFVLDVDVWGVFVEELFDSFVVAIFYY